MYPPPLPAAQDILEKIDGGICMLCKNKGFSFINNLRDADDRWAVRCNVCGHIQVYPLPKNDEDIEYYKNNYEQNNTYKKAGYINADNIQLMNKFEKWAEYYVKSVKNIILDNHQKILEIGSGYGWFVEKMRNEGYTIDGVEIGRERAGLAYHRSGITLMNHNFLVDTPTKGMFEYYDVVCMFHVLEHINDPIAFLTNIKKCLKPSGLLIVEVPNFLDYNKQLSTAYNRSVYFRAHVSYFKPDTLRQILLKTGFQNIVIQGVQRYSIENAIRWIRMGKPNTEYVELELPEGLEWVNSYYKGVMEKELKSYAILGTANRT